MAPAEVGECFRMVTDRAAAVLGLGDRYGIEAGRPASFVLLPATDPFDVIRRQVRPSSVVSHGAVIATTPSAPTTLTWPGRDAEEIDFQRLKDAGSGQTA
jgi:cytosine deaminase